MRKFADKEQTKNRQTNKQTFQRLRPLYLLWILIYYIRDVVILFVNKSNRILILIINN